MKVKIKKLHPNAVIPSYAKNGDAGLDLVAVDQEFSDDFMYNEYKTGLSIEIPEGHVGLIFPRSSISNKSAFIANSVGVIDSGYRGEITVRMKSDPNAVAYALNPSGASEIGYELRAYKVGDKIAQLIIIPYPQIEFEEVEDLSETERGEGGYGSSDVK